jgi:hypothetical protein
MGSMDCKLVGNVVGTVQGMVLGMVVGMVHSTLACNVEGKVRSSRDHCNSLKARQQPRKALPSKQTVCSS